MTDYLVRFIQNMCIWGLTATETAEAFYITREQQDEWAVRSHERALAAIDGQGNLLKKLSQ